jgi:uncharacterized protein YjbI with pentapeptide repeats
MAPPRKTGFSGARLEMADYKKSDLSSAVADKDDLSRVYLKGSDLSSAGEVNIRLGIRILGGASLRNKHGRIGSKVFQRRKV